MRKYLIALVVLTLVITTVFCCACGAELVKIEPTVVTISFENNQTAMAAMDAYATAHEDFTFDHSYNEGYKSETVLSVKKGEVSIVDDYTTNTYISYYINKKDATLIDAAVDPIEYDNEEYYLTLATVEKLTVTEGFKIAFVTVTWDGNFTSSKVNSTPAIVISFANA